MIKIVLGILIGGAIGAGMGYYGKCTTGACPLTANPWRGSLYGACMGFFIALASGGIPVREVEEVSAEVREAGRKRIVQVESADVFQSLVKEAKGPVLVDMYADWCGPCRSLAPIIDKLAVDFDGKATVAKVDTDALPDLAKRYDVSALPTILIFSNGEVVQRIVGVNPSERYAEELNRFLESPTDASKE